jgi:acyl-CoA reductase-like NAD-dependent aldehyde dehydrogenase
VVESESGRTFASVSPGSGETIATVPEGTRADAARAVQAAHRARERMASRGPFAPVIGFASEEEAPRLANDSPYGLLGAVYTRDIARAFRFARGMETGWVNVNESSNYWEAHLPFGGRSGKESGLGRVGGRFALEKMTDLKTVVVDTED